MPACSASLHGACALGVQDEDANLRSSFPGRPLGKLQGDKSFAATPDQSSGYWGWGAEEPQVRGYAVPPSPPHCLPSRGASAGRRHLSGGDALSPHPRLAPPCLRPSPGRDESSLVSQTFSGFKHPFGFMGHCFWGCRRWLWDCDPGL